jgi:hypothetical protein
LYLQHDMHGSEALSEARNCARQLTNPMEIPQ